MAHTVWILFAELSAVAALLVLAALIAHSELLRRAHGDERLLLVGQSPMMVALVAEIDARPELGWRIVGLVADTTGGRVPEIGPWLGPLTALADIIGATRPTRVVVAPADRRKTSVEGPLIDARLHGVTVEDTIRTLERATGKLPIEQLSTRSLLLSDGFRHSDFVATDTMLVVTRVLSFIGALGGLIGLAPVLGLIAAAIKIDSRGPVLFVQPRMGVGGQPFGLLKFRTMREAGAQHSEWVRDNEHRITRVGRVLRRFRIDELPQLVNVLRGQMNFVGPRPHPVSNYYLFLERIPHYRLRSAVRPGITGWAQIRYGYANGLEEETEKMRYDLYYIKHRSLAFDVQILFATFGVLLFDRRSHEQVRHQPTPAVVPPAWSRTQPGVTVR
jgi:exopolysaccharide biosynthesis polyprenyl glycosylphosphotransferase